MVLQDRIRKTLESKEDIESKKRITENIITTLAFLNFLRFFGICMLVLSIFFFVESNFMLNLVTLVFTAMGFFFMISGTMWSDRLKRRLHHDVY